MVGIEFGEYEQSRVDEVCLWVALNPKAFWSLVDICEEASRDRRLKSVGRDYVYTQAMLRRIAVEDPTIAVVRAHAPWSVISRYIIMLRPELSRVICPVRCRIDGPDYVEAWNRIVGTGTEFRGNDWYEAKQWYLRQSTYALGA